jgi:uncharacterized radical SAM superfamily protein
VVFAVPGARHYANRHYANRPSSWANVSVTGGACTRGCAHCDGQMLQRMTPATTPASFAALIDRFIADGGEGLLVSGGADERGRVPVEPFLPVLASATERGLRVAVHTGLVDRAMAQGLLAAGVEQVLLEVVGDQSTIDDVLHLEVTPADYHRSMLLCRGLGLAIAPHLVVGLHFGAVRGEFEALRMVADADPQALVVVALQPLRDTPMQAVTPPTAHAVLKVLAAARERLPATLLGLGCARPYGADKVQLELDALDAGVDVVAFPDPAAVDHARAAGRHVEFREVCCSLAAVTAGVREEPIHR